MFYCSTYDPKSEECFLICFKGQNDDAPQTEADIVALVQMKEDQIQWHKDERDAQDYHFNEYLMLEDMKRYRDLYLEGKYDGVEFGAPFPCLLNGSMVTYTWESA